MSKVEIIIGKVNVLTRAEFKSLIADPKIHLQFLKQRLMIESKDNLDDIIAEIDSVVTDVYYVDYLASNFIGVVYFWSQKDFAQVRI